MRISKGDDGNRKGKGTESLHSPSRSGERKCEADLLEQISRRLKNKQKEKS